MPWGNYSIANTCCQCCHALQDIPSVVCEGEINVGSRWWWVSEGKASRTPLFNYSRLMVSTTCKYSSNISYVFLVESCRFADIHFCSVVGPRQPTASTRSWKNWLLANNVFSMCINKSRCIRKQYRSILSPQWLLEKIILNEPLGGFLPIMMDVVSGSRWRVSGGKVVVILLVILCFSRSACSINEEKYLLY